MSHVRLAPKPEDLHAVRIAAGGANLVLGCDMVVAAAPAALSRIEQGVTKAVINGYIQPVAAFVTNGDMDLGAEAMMKTIRDAAGEEATTFVDGTGLATAILGNSIATNLFMLGYAWQKGLVPLSLEALDARHRAERRRRRGQQAHLRLGPAGRPQPRRGAGRGQADAAGREAVARTLAEIVAKRVELLTAYQDKAYAARYAAFVDKVAKAEKAKAPGRHGLAEAVAKSLYKLMAYKDEYEVARLYSDGEFLKKLGTQFEGDYKLTFHLAPPLVRRARSRDRPAQEARVRRLGDADVPLPRLAEAPARHAARRLRLLRGTPHGTPPDRRIRSDRRTACWPRSTRTTMGWPCRSPRCPRRCAASATSRKRT